MAALQQHSWLDFLFDESGDKLKKHLGDESAEPAAIQLIVQFLERARVTTNNLEGTLIENPRAKRLHQLALIVASHLEWNFQILEDSLPLPWQHLLFTALKRSAPAVKEPGDEELSKLDCRSAMIVIIYYRWVVRTFAQNLSSVRQSSNGMADLAITESIMKLLEEQVPAAVKTLEQVQSLSEDMELPDPSVEIETQKAQNEEVSEAQGDATCNGYTANKEDKMQVCSDEVNSVRKVTKEEVIAQVAFDLGTLYFYQEKFEDAKRWFENCANVKCSRSSFFVDEERLHGFYAACCGLLGLSSSTSSVMTIDQPSLVVQLQNCRASEFKDIVPILIQDNLSLELPMDYRRSLVRELRDLKTTSPAQPEESAVSMEWKVSACNAVRDILEDRTVEPGFWTSLKNCTQPQMEFILSLCAQSVSIKMETSEQDVCNKNLDSVRSFVRLLCSCVESVDAWVILKNSDAKQIIFSSEEEDLLNATRVRKPRRAPFEWRNGDHLSSSQVGEDITLQVGLLQLKLRASFDPDEISNLLEELHKLERGKNHSENFVCLVYKSRLDEIKDPVVHDLLHALFSKAIHCSAIQEYGAAGNLLAYGLGRMSDVSSRTASPASVEKVRTALYQELLVLDIAQDKNNKRSEEITNKVKSYLWQTSQNKLHDLKLHVEGQVTAYLVNSKEWEFLSELKLDESVDNSGLGCRLLGRLLGATCCSLANPQIWRKAARNLWDGVSQIFSGTGQQKRPQDGGMAMSVHRGLNGINMSNFIRFVNNLKEETSLSVLISCLVKLQFAGSEEESDSHKEIFSAYSHLWPTTITNRSLLNTSQVATTLSVVVNHALSVQSNNPSWLHTMADLYIASSNHSAALKCFLEAGATASSLFTLPVPNSVWDDQVFRKMIICCSALKAHIQVAVLCQCTEPKDYSTAFKAAQQAALSSEDAMDFYYNFFWDIAVLEYLVHIHAKRGQNDKKQLAVQAISQPELNMFNSPDILQHSESRRKSTFFRAMAKQYL